MLNKINYVKWERGKGCNDIPCIGQMIIRGNKEIPTLGVTNAGQACWAEGIKWVTQHKIHSGSY